MLFPLLLGAALLFFLAFGARKGHAGYQKHAQAQRIARDVQSLYARRKSVFDQQQTETTLALELLGKKEMQIGERIGAFKVLADRIVAQLNADLPQPLVINVPAHELQRIEHCSHTASGFAVHGGAMAPVLAIAGWAYENLGEKAFRNAQQRENRLQAVVGKMVRATERLDETQDCARRIKRTLTCVHAHFNQYFDSLQSIELFLQELQASQADRGVELGKFQHVAVRTIENGYALASILVDVIATPLYSLKQREGEVVQSADGVPQQATDADGLPVVNQEGLEWSLRNARRQAGEIEPA